MAKYSYISLYIRATPGGLGYLWYIDSNLSAATTRRAKQYNNTLMEAQGERRYIARWGEWSASRPGRVLPPGKGPPGTYCTGGSVGPRACLNTENTETIHCLWRDRTPIARSVARHYTAWATPAPATTWIHHKRARTNITANPPSPCKWRQWSHIVNITASLWYVFFFHE
jgi:hypothetical protein